MNKKPIDAVWKLAGRSLTKDLDLTVAEVSHLLELALEVKRDPAAFARALGGRYLALLFEKPSLRTRVTFELSIKQLGGDSILSVGPVADREPVKDVARNLDRWTNGIVARTFLHDALPISSAWRAGPRCRSSTR